MFVALRGRVLELMLEGQEGSGGGAEGWGLSGRRDVEVGGWGRVAHQQGGGGVVFRVLRWAMRAEWVPT